jgi:hypothetical protein
MGRLMTVVLLACSISLLPAQAMAADRPAAQWETFTKVAALKDCLNYAQAAMEKKHYKIHDKARDGDYKVIGGDETVIVQVVCVPQKDNRVWIFVSAFSSDAKTAALARDGIRDYIKNQVRIDK